MLRPARPADARAIAEVQVRAWWHTYRDYVDPDLLAEHTVELRTERWGAILAASERHPTALVVDVGGRVAGFASFGAARSAHPEPGTGELWALYVDPAAQGAGAGTTLLAAAEDSLRAEGFERAMLWVFVRNELARRFYASRGWAPDDPPLLMDDAWSTEIRYRKELR
jgi:ribosomal protein S18 acetylase RimI-like enzyme